MDVFDLFATISIKTDEFERGLDRASAKFKSFSNEVTGLSGKVDSLYKSVGNALKPAIDGFQAAEGVGKSAGNAISSGLKGFAVASTAVAGFGAAAVNSGMQFDTAMSKVSAISGATGDEFDALRDKALEMGAKTKFSASEAGEAMTYMGMAGWKAGDMISGIEGIMNLAAASGEDLATTSDIVTDALTALGLQASDSGHFADVLAAASSNANTNVGLMGETFKYAAPLAGAMGYTAEDTALAIGLMANAGIKGSQSGTALRSIMTRLAKPTKESATAMGALGISITNSDGSMKPFGTTISELREAFSGLSEEQKATYAAMLGGQEAMSGLLAIVNAAPADVEKLTNALDDCNGAAEEMASTMEDNLAGDITLVKSAFESLQISISDSLTPTLREFAQFGQKAMAKLLEGFQGGGVLGFMSALSGIVTDGVNMLMGKAPDFVWVSTNFIMALATGLLDSSDKILSAGNEIINYLFSTLNEYLYNRESDMVSFGIEIIDLIASGFSKAGKTITAHIGEFIPLIADAFLVYHEILFTVGMDILGAIGQGIIEHKETIQEWASETITNMVTSLRDNAPMIIDGAIALLEALVGAIEENLPYILEAGAAIVGELISGISTASPGVQAIIGAAILPHILKIIDVAQNVGSVVSTVIGAVTTGLKALWATMLANPITAIIAIVAALTAGIIVLWNTNEDFRNAVGAIWEAIKGFFVGAWEAIQAAWGAAGEFFSGIVDGIKGAFDGIGDFLGGLFEAAWEMVQGAWDAAVEFFAGIGDGIHEAFETVTSFLGDAFSAAWDTVFGAWEAATGFFGDIWDNIKGAAEKAADKIGGALSDAWDAVTSAWDGAMDFFSGIWGSIKDVFGNAWESFKGIGSNMLEGLWNGISDKIGWLKSKVTGIVDIIKGWFTGKSGFDEHSPSKWSETVFYRVMQGGVNGLDDGESLLMREVNSISDRVKSGLNFGTANVGVNASYSAARYGAQETAGRIGGWGNTTVNIYSPEAVDGVQAARVWKKEAQKMAIAYV